MGFDKIAKNLLQNTKALPRPNSGKDDLEADLIAAGFSRKEILQRYAELYDATEEDSVKRQILDKMAAMQGMTESDEIKKVPSINIHVSGDNSRVALMLNPKLAQAASGEA